LQIAKFQAVLERENLSKNILEKRFLITWPVFPAYCFLYPKVEMVLLTGKFSPNSGKR
jgi:hypothetical protein